MKPFGPTHRDTSVTLHSAGVVGRSCAENRGGGGRGVRSGHRVKSAPRGLKGERLMAPRTWGRVWDT